MAEVGEIRTKIRKKAPTVAQEPVRPDPFERLTEKRAPLDLKMPFATRRQQLTFLTRTHDGKLIFQGQKTGKVITTDAFGYRVDGGPRAATQFVFNGIPEELRRTRARSRFAIGDVVFTVKPMTRNRKIYAGRVEAFDPKGLVLRVLGTNDKDKFNRMRTRSDGHVVVPHGLCFKTPEHVAMFIHKLSDDFERSKTDYRQLLENTRGVTH